VPFGLYLFRRRAVAGPVGGVQPGPPHVRPNLLRAFGHTLAAIHSRISRFKEGGSSVHVTPPARDASISR
jgi:hypothetical protein